MNQKGIKMSLNFSALEAALLKAEAVFSFLASFQCVNSCPQLKSCLISSSFLDILLSLPVQKHFLPEKSSRNPLVTNSWVFSFFFSRLSKIYERITSMCQKYASRKVVVHTCSFWSNLGKKFHISTLVTRRFDWKQLLDNNVQIQFIIGWKYANRLKKIYSNILYRNQGDYKSFSIKNYTLISTSLMLLQSDDVGIVKSGLRKASGHLWNGGLGKLCS